MKLVYLTLRKFNNKMDLKSLARCRDSVSAPVSSMGALLSRKVGYLTIAIKKFKNEMELYYAIHIRSL